MRLDGRRQSGNVEDRRERGAGGKLAGGGIVALVVAALFTWLSGGNPLDVLIGNSGALINDNRPEQTYTPTAEEEELAVFASQILAGTEDVWTEIFRQNGLEYEPPKMVLFRIRAERMWRRYLIDRTVLLLGRSDSISRSIIFYRYEAYTGSRRRLRLCLRYSP